MIIVFQKKLNTESKEIEDIKKNQKRTSTDEKYNI